MEKRNYSKELIEGYRKVIKETNATTDKAQDLLKVYLVIQTIEKFTKDAASAVQLSIAVKSESIETQFGCLAVMNYVESLRKGVSGFYNSELEPSENIDSLTKGLMGVTSPEYNLLKPFGEVQIPLLDDLIDLKEGLLELLAYRP